MVKKINAFKTNDGKVFEDETLANEHEANLKAAHAVTEIVEREYFNGMCSDDIINLILSNKNQITEIFNTLKK